MTSLLDILHAYGLQKSEGNCVFSKVTDAAGDHWITVHPNGSGKGQAVLLSKGGEVLGGMGGKFNGMHISSVRGSGDPLTGENVKLQSEKYAAAHPKKADTSEIKNAKTKANYNKAITNFRKKVAAKPNPHLRKWTPKEHLKYANEMFSESVKELKNPELLKNSLSSQIKRADNLRNKIEGNSPEEVAAREKYDALLKVIKPLEKFAPEDYYEDDNTPNENVSGPAKEKDNYGVEDVISDLMVNAKYGSAEEKAKAEKELKYWKAESAARHANYEKKKNEFRKKVDKAYAELTKKPEMPRAIKQLKQQYEQLSLF